MGTFRSRASRSGQRITPTKLQAAPRSSTVLPGQSPAKRGATLPLGAWALTLGGASWLLLGCFLLLPLLLILARGIFPDVLAGSFAAPFEGWLRLMGREDLRSAMV